MQVDSVQAEAVPPLTCLPYFLRPVPAHLDLALLVFIVCKKGEPCAHTSCCACLQAALNEGMESMSQAKVGSALQVFFNLEQLNQVRSAASKLQFGALFA